MVLEEARLGKKTGRTANGMELGDGGLPAHGGDGDGMEGCCSSAREESTGNKRVGKTELD